MSSKYKIMILTFLVTVGFLARDTVMISGPIQMTPTYITFFSSLILSLLLIPLTENKKSHNHSKLTLSLVGFFVSVLSIFLAYLLEWQTYGSQGFLTALQENLQKAIDNLTNFGFLIVLAAILFGLLAGSNKNLRTTYSYQSSKHITSQLPYQGYGKHRKK